MTPNPLELAAGRPLAPRRDSLATRRLLIDGVGSYAHEVGRPPTRLADVARHVGLSTATAYRHFASLDDLANAHLARLPEQAVHTFQKRRRSSDEPIETFARWNRAWVAACVAHARTAIPLRSTTGFMRRRADADPLVAYVCAHVEPLLDACRIPLERGLVVWNAVSDPREVMDLKDTLRYTQRHIADHITAITLATRP